MLVKGGNVYRGDHLLHEEDLFVESGHIAVSGSDEETIDATGCFVIPGFIDIHTHGGDGVDVNHIDSESLRKLARFFASQGTTSFLSSVLTDTEEKTRSLMHFLGQNVDTDIGGATLAGIHLEGPFISREYKGAMPEELLQKASIELYRQYDAASGHHVRYLTIAPEVEGALDFIERMHDEVPCSIGHSGADYALAWKAIRAGAKASTHTFNAMKLFHMHEPAISGAILESDIAAEMIADGRHLHPGTVRLMLKTKGYDHIVAVTDSIEAAGLPDGVYELGVNTVKVESGDAKLLNGVRAGSTLTTIQALHNLMSFTSQSLACVLPLLTENPAKLVGLWERKGSLDAGKDADFLILDQNYQIVRTYVKGVCVYHKGE